MVISFGGRDRMLKNFDTHVKERYSSWYLSLQSPLGFVQIDRIKNVFWNLWFLLLTGLGFRPNLNPMTGEDVYPHGTSELILKQLYAGSYITYRKNFRIEDISCAIYLRPFAISLSPLSGQRFMKCICKTQCHSICVTGNLQHLCKKCKENANSKHHSDLSCSNKKNFFYLIILLRKFYIYLILLLSFINFYHVSCLKIFYFCEKNIKEQFKIKSILCLLQQIGSYFYPAFTIWQPCTVFLISFIIVF